MVPRCLPSGEMTHTPPGAVSERALRSLTLNEWTALTSVAVWLWFVLLALREWRTDLRRPLSGYTATAGVSALLLAGCLAAAAHQAFHVASAVVVVPEAIARTGPLEEAKVLHQFRDGIELTVLDRKALAVGDQQQDWLLVRDQANRTGWVKSDQVMIVH